MPKKNIIILNYGLHIAGVSRTLVNFCNALVHHGYDVTLKIEINDFTLLDELDPRVNCSLFLKEPHLFGKRIKGFLRFYDLYLKILLKLPAYLQYKFVVRKKYDVEIAFNRGAAANIISASTNRSAKKLVWVHSDYTKNSNPLAGFPSLKKAQDEYMRFDNVVCVSKQSEKAFAQKFGEGFPLITKYNIMDINSIVSKSKERIISKQSFTIVAVGRLSEPKNYKLLLDAVKILNHKDFEFDCWIVGGGELENELITYKNHNNLANVYFLGPQVNPYPYFLAADVYVSSSIYEGLSTTTIEALILGKPCIVTDCTGMRDILGENNEYGIVVPITAEALSEAILNMANDKNMFKYYQEKATERAKLFNPETAFRDIESLF